MRKIGLVVILFFVIVVGIIVVRFGSALFQERNPTPILAAVFYLELSKSEYEPFSERKKEKRYVSKITRDSRYDVIKVFMKEKGWEFIEQMGSGFIFKKMEKTIVVETRQFSRHYFLWDIPNEAMN